MLTFNSFTGINNVVPSHRLPDGDMIEAADVDIGLTGDISRRSGFTEISAHCHKNLWQASGFLLATCGAALTAIWPDGTRYTVHPAVGPGRTWFCNLPDGRTTYTNGLIHGVTDGKVSSERSVPAPWSLGVPDEAFGALHPGRYRYHLTYVRLADRMEGTAISSAPIAILQGGLHLDGLPQADGFEINVYLSGMDGEGGYLAGTTTGKEFDYTGNNAALVLPCRTLDALPFPVGTITAYWRGRVLVAQGSVLWASRASAPHLSDWRDFKPFDAAITLVQPVDDGVYVGTAKDLIFLSGATWDQLAYVPMRLGAVVLGSGVPAPGDRIKLGGGTGSGSAMLCIAGGEIVAGFNGGQAASLTSGRYRSTATEVCATFREIEGGVPQYLASPQ